MLFLQRCQWQRHSPTTGALKIDCPVPGLWLCRDNISTRHIPTLEYWWMWWTVMLVIKSQGFCVQMESVDKVFSLRARRPVVGQPITVMPWLNEELKQNVDRWFRSSVNSISNRLSKGQKKPPPAPDDDSLTLPNEPPPLPSAAAATVTEWCISSLISQVFCQTVSCCLCWRPECAKRRHYSHWTVPRSVLLPT